MLGFLATYYLFPILSEITNVTRSNSYSKIHRRKIVVTFIFPNAQLTSAPTPPGSLSNFSYLEKRKKTYGQSLVGIQVHSRTSADFCHICNLSKFCIFNNLLKNMLPSEPKFPKKSHCVAPRFRYHCILHRYLYPFTPS